MKKLFITLLALLTACFISCNQTDEPITPGQDPMQIEGAVRPVGTSLGSAFTQLIGPAGGSVQSPDGTLTLTVPAGALKTSTEVGIEPITSTCLGSIGHGWRLTPHGETFAKPVEITLNYASLKDSITLPNALGLAYQDDKGIWRFIGASTINHLTHTLTLSTNHFSDWALLHWMTLSPIAERLHEKEQVTLKALQYIALVDKEDEYLVPIAPNYEDGYPVGDPQPLPQKYIKKWSLAGAGKLTPSANGREAVYTAPDNIRTTEIAAVSLSLQGFSGQPFLVSNLTLLGKEPIIDYLLVDERDGFGGKQSILTIYGSNFGAQGNTSKITINGAPLEDISLWGDNIIVCAIPLIGPNSTGQLQIVAAGGAISKPHLLNEWNVVMEINRPCASIEQTLYHKGTIHLRIRGDASVPPQELTIIGKDHQRTVNLLSYVHWEEGVKVHRC